MDIQSRIEFIEKYVLLSRYDKDASLTHPAIPFLTSLIVLSKRYPKLVTAIEDCCKKYPEEINKQDSYKKTPLLRSLHNINIVRVLCQYGANVNHKDCFLQTVLYISLMNCNNVNMIKLLLEYDANMEPIKYAGKAYSKMFNDIFLLNIKN